LSSVTQVWATEQDWRTNSRSAPVLQRDWTVRMVLISRGSKGGRRKSREAQNRRRIQVQHDLFRFSYPRAMAKMRCPHQCLDRLLDQPRLAPVHKAGRYALTQPKRLIPLLWQQRPAIRGHLPAVPGAIAPAL
jgi:hypothetical protein